MRKGTDLITLDTLTELGACDEGKEFFAEHHPEGGEYQKVLDAACEHDHSNFAGWLLNKLGPTDAVLDVDKNQPHCDRQNQTHQPDVRRICTVGGKP